MREQTAKNERAVVANIRNLYFWEHIYPGVKVSFKWRDEEFTVDCSEAVCTGEIYNYLINLTLKVFPTHKNQEGMSISKIHLIWINVKHLRDKSKGFTEKINFGYLLLGV